MSQRVGILGAAHTILAGRRNDVRLEELVFEAAAAALEDAGMTRGEIGTVVMAGADQLDGRSISSMMTAGPAGAYLKDEIRTTAEGSHAAILACLRILSGDFETALAISWSKTSESPYDLVSSLSYDPFYHRPLGFNDVVESAIVASTYPGSAPGLAEAAQAVVLKNRASGASNPRAFLRRPISRETILASPYVAYPIRRAELPQPCDGAVALVLASPERTLQSVRPAVWIQGFGWGSSEYGSRGYVASALAGLRVAAERAYAMARVEQPQRELDFAEVFDGIPFHEVLAYEALGLTSPGGGSAFALDGSSAPGGICPVNPSGGVQSSNLRFASGLMRILEAYLQLSLRAGPVQLTRPKQGLAHGASGYPAQSHAVFVLRNY